LYNAPVILSVDTASLGGSVCLVSGSTVLATRVGDPTVSHSNTLLKDIDECLARSEVSLTDVNLFAAASGPGSFTGLRIGLATVKALAVTLGRPCVGIPTLQAVAHAAGPSTATVALLPAGRGEVFVQMLSVSPDGKVAQLDAPAHLSPQKVVEKYGGLTDLKWAGEGARVYREILVAYSREQGIDFGEDGALEAIQHPGWTFAQKQENLSKHVAALALQRLQSGEVLEPMSLTAIYVRPSDAELKCP
jgi:tRNA threonylcarbamoyladenosine biosynthesis protein TsaB